MPFFDYKCKECGYKVEIYFKVEGQVYKCPYCDIPMTKLMPSPAVRGDYEPYNCPITGKLISGKREHEENLKRHHCRVLEPGEARDAARVRAEADKALEDKICETAAREVEKMSPRQQEQLALDLGC